MSVQVNGTASPLLSARDSVERSSKKRKHDGTDKHSSKKKRKHGDALADTDTVSVPVEGEGVKKKKRDKKRKAEEIRLEEQNEEVKKEKNKKKRPEKAIPQSIGTADEGIPIEEEEEELKKEKRKKRKSEKVIPDKSSTSEESAATDEDIELPDAPSIDAAHSPVPDEDDSQPTQVEDSEPAVIETVIYENLLELEDPSCFYSTRISLYVAIPAVSLTSAQSSILSTHLAPLLLTYFPPAKGVVLAFSDPVLSAKPDTASNLPLQEPSNEGFMVQEVGSDTLARSADEFGVSWVWLTATFLVFRPEQGDDLHGWTNVVSDGLVGIVSYNYFQTAVGMSRIPEQWTWNGPQSETPGRRKGKKGKLRYEDEEGNHNHEGVSMKEDFQTTPNGPIGDEEAIWLDEDGERVAEVLAFRVVDTEPVPSHEKNKWSLQIHGSLLDADAEQEKLEEERIKFQRKPARSRSRTPAVDVSMSGGLGRSREASVTSTPRRRRMSYEYE